MKSFNDMKEAQSNFKFQSIPRRNKFNFKPGRFLNAVNRIQAETPFNATPAELEASIAKLNKIEIAIEIEREKENKSLDPCFQMGIHNIANLVTSRIESYTYRKNAYGVSLFSKVSVDEKQTTPGLISSMLQSLAKK